MLVEILVKRREKVRLRAGTDDSTALTSYIRLWFVSNEIEGQLVESKIMIYDV